MTIFIVEDERSTHFIYSSILNMLGHEIVGFASNGEEAIKKYKEFKTKPDIILMDHRMPIKNGLEASHEILRITPDAKIIFISADTTIEKNAIDMGALAFFTKPFNFDDLNVYLTSA